MTNSEVAKKESTVPALVTTPALEIDGGDIALPKLYLGQALSEAVTAELVKQGQLYVATGPDDLEPTVVYDNKNAKDEGVLVHILGMTKAKSVQRDGELIRYDFNDPDAPSDAWVVYNYVVVLPEIEPDVPVRWTLTRSGAPVAKQINLLLGKHAAKGPAWDLAFRVTSKEATSKAQGKKYFKPVAKLVEATPENVELATKLAALVGPNAAESNATGEEPAI